MKKMEISSREHKKCNLRKTKLAIIKEKLVKKIYESSDVNYCIYHWICHFFYMQYL